MKYRIEYTSRFEKDLRQAAKRGKNLDKLFAVIEKLAADEPLDQKNMAHMLVGEYSGYWECHIEADWLLVYEKIRRCFGVVDVSHGHSFRPFFISAHFCNLKLFKPFVDYLRNRCIIFI